MAFFESLRLKDTTSTEVNPATEESITLLRRITQLLKPLGVITGAGSNRLSVDVNNITGGTITTVSTVTTVTTATNLTNLVPGAGTIGPVPGAGFDLMKTMSRQAYNSGIRSNIT
jgi:hypothetical protein